MSSTTGSLNSISISSVLILKKGFEFFLISDRMPSIWKSTSNFSLQSLFGQVIIYSIFSPKVLFLSLNSKKSRSLIFNFRIKHFCSNFTTINLYEDYGDHDSHHKFILRILQLSHRLDLSPEITCFYIITHQCCQ